MLLSHYVDNHWMLLADVIASWLLMADVFSQCGRCKATIFDCVNPITSVTQKQSKSLAKIQQ